MFSECFLTYIFAIPNSLDRSVSFISNIDGGQHSSDQNFSEIRRRTGQASRVFLRFSV